MRLLLLVEKPDGLWGKKMLLSLVVFPGCSSNVYQMVAVWTDHGLCGCGPLWFSMLSEGIRCGGCFAQLLDDSQCCTPLSSPPFGWPCDPQQGQQQQHSLMFKHPSRRLSCLLSVLCKAQVNLNTAKEWLCCCVVVVIVCCVLFLILVLLLQLFTVSVFFKAWSTMTWYPEDLKTLLREMEFVLISMNG